jgi:NSS family neurotransmitter:Na+ symporter
MSTAGKVEERASFSGRIGFILAAAGSAVGLGNIWRFPYLAAEHGGGTFLLIYVLLAMTFGFALMITEIALGRKTGKSVIGAFSKISSKWGFLGLLVALVPTIIVPYYSVIGGWVLKYFSVYSLGGGTSSPASSGFFGEFTGDVVQNLFFWALYLGLTTLIILLGVEKGIEWMGKIMMPALIALLLFVTAYSLTMPNAMDGVLYYITPKLEHLNASTFVAAIGQMFYSLSLAMGVMVTYGSYMRKKDNIVGATKSVLLFDSGVAFFAGLAIIPAVISFSGGDKGAIDAGPSMMFETMPKVFESMGQMGAVIGAAFFLLVLFAAITSSVSMMETVVSVFCDRFNIKRVLSILISLGIFILLSLPSALGFNVLSWFTPFGLGILDFFDTLTNNFLMPIVAILTCIFVGFVMKPETIISEVELSGTFKSKRFYSVFIKFVAPVLILMIFVSNLV